MSYRTAAAPIFFTTEFGPVTQTIFGVCLCISLYLIIRMWRKYREDALSKKLLWSVALLVPLAGWVFYARFYHPLPETPAPRDLRPSSRAPRLLPRVRP